MLGHMPNGLRFLLRQVVWELRYGLLARPVAVTLVYVAMAVGMLAAERRFPELTALATRIAFMSQEDVAGSQLILATIAGSMMTTISIVFAVLLMALSLASLQFSPRILMGFMGDRPTQYTLGVFLGTFLYCLMVLRTVHGEPNAFVPAASITGAMLLAAMALGCLIYFIHHIAQSIHANNIVDRIACETLEVVDEEFPTVVGRADTHPEETGPPPPLPDGAVDVAAAASGYVQLVNRERLTELARANGLTIYQRHGVGEFAVEGNPIVSIVPAERLTLEIAKACADSFDIGPARTLQQDVHFGIRQIVDMALKAISPAVNDPSTAVTCIDHLGRILCRLARRRILPLEVRDPASGRLLMLRRAVTFQGSLDLAFNQLRQYGKRDMAVSLRMLHALTEIATATDHPPHQARALHHAGLIESALDPDFQQPDRAELHRRLASLRSRVTEGRRSLPPPSLTRP
jgi:uncharacterized membrane protein